MVAVANALNDQDSRALLDQMAEGLCHTDKAKIEKAFLWAEETYEGHVLGTGESVLPHAVGMTLIVASMRLDADARIAALLFAMDEYEHRAQERIAAEFGEHVACLTQGLHKLNGLRVLTRSAANAVAPAIRAQTEVLRKMLLAMVEDIRVVLLRLASRTQTLRYHTGSENRLLGEIARETLDIYAPLANRLGVWQLKWEMEDLSFRFLEPDTYKRIARMLDERRVEREQFIQEAIARLKEEIARIGLEASIYGRPKHIYSIYNKMKAKRLDFSELYDIRALRVLVPEIQDCYSALGVVHHLWQPIAKEYDDYILKPKGNNYRSLHTAVLAADGRALEVQIRTHEMHRHAEFGVAAHWRYKEGGASASEYDEKIALLRNLLAWREEIAESADWVEQFKRASLDDTLYVLTPQGRVVDLPRGATPIDFAYRVHTSLGHRCRGAKIDGQLLPLNTPLHSGQTVDIQSAREGGPSRDWLNPTLAYVVTSRARHKIRQYFAQMEEEELLTRGRQMVTRELQREGQTHTNVDELAGRLGFQDTSHLFLAAGRGELAPRAVHLALREPVLEEAQTTEETMPVGAAHTQDPSDKILIVGVGKLMTSLGRCCKPAPPDAIEGFVTRGRGISIHRVDCSDFKTLVQRHPERVISAQWGQAALSIKNSVYPVDIVVEALDRQGLLRDVSDVLSREKINTIAVNTLTKKGKARMRFTIEVANIAQMQRVLRVVRDVQGILQAVRP